MRNDIYQQCRAWNPVSYDGWFLSCEALGFQDVELENASPFSAIMESQRLIERRMETAQMIVKAFHEWGTDVMRG